MPIYDFKCPDGHVTERLFLATSTSGADRPAATMCAACGKTATRLFPTGTGITFAGSGWTPKQHPTIDDLPPWEETQARRSERKP